MTLLLVIFAFFYQKEHVVVQCILKNNSKYLNKYKFTILSDNSDNMFYSDALSLASKSIKHTFFFPGHNQGRYLPTKFKNILFKLDFPELDELDNIHCPEVYFKLWFLIALVANVILFNDNIIGTISDIASTII
jgi:hypothetical protein